MKRSPLRVSSDASRLTVRLKRCKAPGCRKEYVPRSSWQKACSPECVIKLTVADVQKAASEAAKESRKADKVKRESLKTRSDWMREAQTAVNAWVRERDCDQPCISCGRHHEGQYHAGHFRSVGSSPGTRFNTFNIHKQCVVCNTYLSSNALNYRAALIRKIGVEWVERIESDNRERKFTVDYLVRLRDLFRRRLRHTKKLRTKNEANG